jgi:hypothetical protein
VPEYGQILSKFIPVLGLQSASNISHEFIKAPGKSTLLVWGLGGEDLSFQTSEDLLIDKNER